MTCAYRSLQIQNLHHSPMDWVYRKVQYPLRRDCLFLGPITCLIYLLMQWNVIHSTVLSASFDSYSKVLTDLKYLPNNLAFCFPIYLTCKINSHNAFVKYQTVFFLFCFIFHLSVFILCLYNCLVL